MDSGAVTGVRLLLASEGRETEGLADGSQADNAE